ncbi:hypothetical protein SUDANB121_02921 [Nocardiopsis dassonvillei]|uniref:hypothetical protein n=1 Tax=Nocardiopsis dassonvillei TaxID=2014 RepID=UPI003F544D2F
MESKRDNEGESVTPFAHLRLVGGRFEREGLPLETVHELERYGRIVMEVAKDLWKARHPGRNLPAGFAQALSLRLRGVKPGSVVPVITRTETSLAIESQDILDEARDVVDEAFNKIVSGAWDQVDLPSKAMRPLKRFGASFGEKEALYLRDDNAEKKIRWDQRVRRRYLAHKNETTIEVDGAIIGTVRATDSVESTFSIVIPGHDSPVPGRYSDPALYEDLYGSQRPSNDVLVRVTCRYRRTFQGDIVDVIDVSEVDEFLKTDAPGGSRLIDLAALLPGWLDGEKGDAIDLSSIEFAREILMQVDERGLPHPRIYPTPAGGVQLEWQDPSLHVELTISSDLSSEIFVLCDDGSEQTKRGSGVDFAMGELVGFFGGV